MYSEMIKHMKLGQSEGYAEEGSQTAVIVATLVPHDSSARKSVARVFLHPKKSMPYSVMYTASIKTTILNNLVF